MTLSPIGEMIFDDEFELVYEVLNELEIELRPDGSIYDPARNTILSMNGLIIKASTNPMQMHYAGQGEMPFDILNNVKLISTLFYHYMQLKEAEGMPLISTYVSELESLRVEKFKTTNLTVKFGVGNECSSPFFHNKCLKFIWMIFGLDQTPVNLQNFDEVKIAELQAERNIK